MNDAQLARDLDKYDAAQAAADVALTMAEEESLGHVGLFVCMLAEEFCNETECHPTSRRWAELMHTIPGGLPPSLEETVRMTAPDMEPSVRLAAMDRLWAKHRKAQDQWIKSAAAAALNPD